jgi:predicted regulator of Ras-like GTPase activity (Roadblock/LC7/MglB family)
MNDPLLKILEDLLRLDDIYACMIARKNMVSVIPDISKFNPKIMEVWDIVSVAMKNVFSIIEEYSIVGLDVMEFRLRNYSVLFFVIPETENALVAIIPSLANKGLIEVEMENARREIVEVLKREEEELIKV